MTARTLSALLSVTLLALPLIAQEEAVPAAPKKADPAKAIAHPGASKTVPIIQLEVAIIAVPKADSLALAEQFKDPANAEKAYRALAAKVQAKQAKLIGYPAFETRSGNRGVIENINEVRYAIQYQPAKHEAAPAAPADHAATTTAPQPAPALVLLPTTFETRNAGITLEAEPVLGADGKTIDVQFAVQHVEFLGWEAAELDDKSAVPRVPQPRFHTNKLSTNMSLQAGQRALAGVFESGTDPETMEFFILTAGTRTLDAK